MARLLLRIMLLLAVMSIFPACQSLFGSDGRKAPIRFSPEQPVGRAASVLMRAEEESEAVKSFFAEHGYPDGIQELALERRLIRINLFYLAREAQYELMKFPDESDPEWFIAGPIRMQWEEYSELVSR